MKSDTITVTPRQLEVLEFIHSVRSGRGVSPTLTEVGAFLGVHKSTARDLVHALREARAISCNDAGAHRSLYVTAAGEAHLEQLGRTG